METGIMKITCARYQKSKKTKDNDSNNMTGAPMTYNITRAVRNIIQ